MRNSLLVFFLGLLALSLISGCATILGGGGTQEVTFNSSPDGAKVSIDGQVLGQTPITLRIDRKSQSTLALQKEGYKPVEIQLNKKMNPWFWGNILFGGLLGSTTDGLTGAIHEYEPNRYYANLTPLGQISAIGIDSRKSSIKSYIVTNYHSIATELSSGQAEYLKTLYDLLEIPEYQRQAAYEDIKMIAQDSKDIYVFATTVAGMYVLNDGGNEVARNFEKSSNQREFANKPAPSKSPAIVYSALSIKSDVDDLPLARPKINKDSYAIVIGIEQYRQKLPNAAFATHDAQKVSEYLIRVLGYPEENVVMLLNDHGTNVDFAKYFEKWLPNNVEASSTVFIYYSGHGAPNPKTGDAYLVPYDGDPSFINETGYSLKRMYAALGKLPAKDIVVALDSCFSGAGGRSVIAKGSRPLVISLQNNMVLSKNMTVLSASSGDQTSSTYDEKGHGLFTYFMLKGLKEEDVIRANGSLNVGDLFDYMKPQVERIARKQYNNEQTPQLLKPQKY